jgi:hypothetical protein
MAEMYKVIIKEVNGKKIYSSNEMSSMMIQFEIDWINTSIDLDGLILIIKPIKGKNARREDLLKKMNKEEKVDLDNIMDNLTKIR